MNTPKPTNEIERLASLTGYQVLDTASETAYDDLTLLAAGICAAPIALISLMDEKRQWFKSKFGWNRSETNRDDAFCPHAILQTGPLIVNDATKDSRFAANALVTGEPHIRFYAGFPLVNAENLALGTLCVMDRRPRRLVPRQKELLRTLARHALLLLEFRRSSQRLLTALEQIKTLNGLLSICSWCKKIRDDHGDWNQVDVYLHQQTGVNFSHGICPECLNQQFPRRQKGTSGTKGPNRTA